MEKRKIFCLVTLACYLLLTILGTALTLSLYSVTQAPAPEGSTSSESLSHGLAGFAAAILMVLTLGYTLLSLLPLLLKLVHVFVNKRFLGVLCLFFDLVFAALHVAIAVGGFSGESLPTLPNVALYLALLLVSATAIYTNVRTLRLSR